jgi:plasmid stabilization system protein ParE
VKVFEVEFSDEARGHVSVIDPWWRANRPSAPTLFSQELAAAVGMLRAIPFVGNVYPPSPEPGMRRLLMPRTQYHLHYVVLDREARVLVHAVWHAKRGHGPVLGA